MANELRILCDLLDGYSDERKFEVLEAKKNPDGSWTLQVIKQGVQPAQPTEEPAAGAGNEVAENDNK